MTPPKKRRNVFCCQTQAGNACTSRMQLIAKVATDACCVIYGGEFYICTVCFEVLASIYRRF